MKNKIKEFTVGETELYIGLEQINIRMCRKMINFYIPELDCLSNEEEEVVDFSNMTWKERKEYILRFIETSLVTVDSYLNQIDSLNKNDEEILRLKEQILDIKNDLITDREAIDY